MAIVLASQSPRRQELLARIGVEDFKTLSLDIDESYPEGLSPEDTVRYIAKKKCDAAAALCAPDDLIITADTMVFLGNDRLGKPRDEEDALRILRLYRFAARFGFAIDEATEAAAKQLASHLDCVSAERIEEELNKLLAAPQPGAYLEPEVLAFVLPELPPEELTKARRRIDTLPAGTEQVSARWAALLLPLGEAGARKALKRLKCSNARMDGVAALVRECGEKTSDAPDRCDLRLQAKRLLGKYDLHTVQQLTALWTALAPEEKGSFDALRAEAEALTAQGVCCRISQLAVNGRDLMAAGAAPGPGLRRVLEALLEEVITGRLPNEKTELLAFAAGFSAS